MNKENISPRTARDALIIELLGDVGSIHDEIKELPNVLKVSLSESLKMIADAVEEAEKTAEKLKKETQAALAASSQAQLHQVQENIGDLVKSSVDTAVEKSLVDTAVEKSLSGAQAEIQTLEDRIYSATAGIKKHNPVMMNYVLAIMMTTIIVTMLFSTIYLWGEVHEAREVTRYAERNLSIASSAINTLPEKYQQQIRDEITKARSKN
ncbi:hypothetical protein [Candidatus Williamhamiltonella defendens]|uniref:hypothetical protein n=1 Tax=Candidatus Williamhamiltonella defendens TaxID=138072 RepID=UPI0003123CCC|nr:hypothetical protein [Candidatus Hamiltonella defensa]